MEALDESELQLRGQGARKARDRHDLQGMPASPLREDLHHPHDVGLVQVVGLQVPDREAVIVGGHGNAGLARRDLYI